MPPEHATLTDLPALERPARTPAATTPWIRGVLWDGLWLQSALWLVPAAFLLAHGHEDPSKSPLDVLVFALTALFWLGHRLGSTWLAYATTAYRPLLRAEPVRFVVVPLAIAATCFAVLVPDDAALPLSRAGRATALATIDFLFVTHHFASQHFGVLSLYRVRSGRSADAKTRRLDRLFALLVGGALVLVVEAVAETTAIRETWFGSALDWDAVAQASGSLRVAATALLAATTCALLVQEVRAPRASVPRVLYVLGVGAMVAGGLHSDRPFLFVAAWTGQHWLAASALATCVASAEPEPDGSPVRRALHAVNRRPWALLLVLGALSVVLLPAMEVEAVRTEGAYYGDRLFGALGAALRTSSWVPVLLALGFTTGFVHYWLDRAVYRVSRPAVRAAARGLFA
jgi:hypothetical protein